MSSDYGVSKNTESFKVRRKGEVIDKFYVERRKNSTSAPITRWRADFLLTPAVVACYLKKKNLFLCIETKNCRLQEVNRYNK